MSFTPASLARSGAGPDARPIADRRRHKRFAVTLLGRFMRSSKHEYPCKLIDISIGGAAMMAPVTVPVGERIMAYFDHLGGLEGRVVRTFDGGFAVEFQASQHKREKLAAQITWLVNRAETGLPDERRHARYVVTDKLLTLKLADGSAIDCRVQDFSLSGASIITVTRPAVGSEVMLGRLRGKVVRHHDQGIAVTFLDLQDAEALRKYFG